MFKLRYLEEFYLFYISFFSFFFFSFVKSMLFTLPNHSSVQGSLEYNLKFK